MQTGTPIYRKKWAPDTSPFCGTALRLGGMTSFRSISRPQSGVATQPRTQVDKIGWHREGVAVLAFTSVSNAVDLGVMKIAEPWLPPDADNPGDENRFAFQTIDKAAAMTSLVAYGRKIHDRVHNAQGLNRPSSINVRVAYVDAFNLALPCAITAKCRLVHDIRRFELVLKWNLYVHRIGGRGSLRASIT